jgi:hypothetical protein
MVVIATALLSGAGCGLSEYEEKMVSEQKRIDYLDNENYYLGEPIQLPPPAAPPAGQEPKPTVDVFFRVPSGISKTADAKPLGDLLHRYLKVQVQRTYGRAARPADASLPENPFEEVQVAVAGDREHDDFVKTVLAPYERYEKSNMTLVTKEAFGRHPLKFQTLTCTYTDAKTQAGWAYLIYFYQQQNWHMAFVFVLPKDRATSKDVLKVVDLSLQSLGLGAEAAQQRSRYHPPKA